MTWIGTADLRVWFPTISLEQIKMNVMHWSVYADLNACSSVRSPHSVLDTCKEMGITGIPRIPRNFCGDGSYVLRGSRGDGMLWDSRGDGKYFTGFPRECIAILDFYCASVQTGESNIHFFHVQNFWCMLNDNDNAKWNISVGCLKFLLINKQFCGNGWGLKRNWTGTGGNENHICWDDWLGMGVIYVPVQVSLLYWS